MTVNHKSLNPTLIIVEFSLLVIGVAQITALWGLAEVIREPIRQSSALETVQTDQFSPQLYRLAVVENQIQLIAIASQTTASSPEMALKDSFTQLLTQPSNSELTTTIPQQTQLLDLQIVEDSIYLDLSQEFSSGGGSTSMIYRVAQVLFTATSINPQASVFLSLEGQPLNEKNPLGGEGLLLKYPLTRQNFTQDFLVK